jgi:hypothetical protein
LLSLAAITLLSAVVVMVAMAGKEATLDTTEAQNDLSP